MKSLQTIITRIMGEKDKVKIDEEAKKIQNKINEVENKLSNNLSNVNRLAFLADLEKIKLLIFTGTKIEKGAVIIKKDELEQIIVKLELEVRRYEAIQKINDYLANEKNGGKDKMTNKDLNESYTNFGKDILRLKNKEKINDLENEVITHIAKLRENCNYLDSLITLGNGAVEKKKIKNLFRNC